MRVEELFRPVRGRYCWRVEVGVGALLTMELGAPRLEIAEERRDGQAYRSVLPRGTWQLALHECSFVISRDHQEVSEADSADALATAAAVLSGQALMSVGTEGTTTLFEFDLGTSLCVEPLEDDSLAWILEGEGRRYGHRNGIVERFESALPQ